MNMSEKVASLLGHGHKANGEENDSKAFQLFIVFLILLNSIALATEHYD